MQSKREKRYKRHRRVRAKVAGTKDCPRLSVFRSNQHTYIQIIDDAVGKILVSASDVKVKKAKLSKLETAKKIGKEIAKNCLKQNIKKVIFDRGGYKYHGRIKAVAEGAREGGLKF